MVVVVVHVVAININLRQTHSGALIEIGEGQTENFVKHLHETDTISVNVYQTSGWALDRVHNSRRSLDRLLHFVTLWPWPLTF